MADDIREVREAEYRDGPETVRRTEVTHDSTDASVSRVQQLIYTITGVLTGLLAIRFVLSLLGANRLNTFADLIYTITGPFVAPFRGLFGVNTQLGVSRFEIETLVAMAVYMLAAWAVVHLLAAGKHHPAGY
jgi:uncharacterized protein YggT (Ycf19 family)